ncbi:MAG: SprB repeat-containing protein, partial [Bacteroidia bacterium]|nr:SprB repeat-containing protein [Bacteroidia bacterium]
MKKITQLFCLSIILFYPIYKTSAQCNVFLAGIKNVTCNGACDGTANALTFGGTAPYTYSWSGGQTSANVTNFCAGVYTLTVKDANTCNITTVATILQAPVLKGTTSTTNAKCNTPGTATITATGGSSPYFFTWNPGGKTGSTISAGAGIYTVTLRDSYGCIKVYIDTIGSDPGAITTAASQVNISCNGLSNGSIAVSPSGGTNPYTYSWSPGGQTTSSRTGLSTGTYNVTITDAGGCTSSRSFLITQPPAITLGGGFGLIGVPAKCNGSNTGSINATTSGGTSPYTYIWSNGATTQLNSGIGAGTYTVTVYDANSCSRTGTATVTEPAVLTVTTTSTTTTATANPTGGTPAYSYSWSNAGSTKTITGLGFGIYTVTVTDLNGCSKTATATVVATCNVTVNGVKNVTCNGACDGTATALAAGTAPYTYSWSGGQTTSSVTNLCAGTFTVSVTDALSCVSTSTTTILQAPALTATVTSTNAKCNTLGTASIIASGGSAPYTYSWSPGGKITSTITAGAGIYTVTLRDNYGCVKMFTDTVKSDPGAITTTASQTN